MTDRQKILVAMVVSLAVHLVIAVLFAAWTWLAPERAVARPALENLEVTLLPTAPEPEPTPTPAPEIAEAPETAPSPRALIPLDTSGMETVEQAPENAIFDSDRNTIAASELPATGDKPLPTQEGRADRPGVSFETKNVSLGEPDRPPGGEKAATPAPTPEPVAATSEPTPEPTPPPPGALVFSSPTPIPVATPIPPKSKELALLDTRPQNRPGYSAQTEKTRIEGGISNRGRAGVNSIATPLGRYRKAVGDAIGSIWYRYINARMSLLSTGSVKVTFEVAPNGTVENVRVHPKPTNSALEMVSIQSVWEARLPPLPPDLVPTLDQGRLEIDYTFTLYPN